MGSKQNEGTAYVQTRDSVQHEQMPPVIRTDSYRDDRHIKLGWRSWMVVFVTCFAIMAQVFVVVAAGSVIAFIIRDLGQPAIAGWVIQGPLLMQSVLSPIVGRLSDVLDRKYLAAGPPLIAFAGAVISAEASSMSMLVGGGILIGVTLSTISIVQTIPAEVLPLKYRALANGFAFLGGAVGGLVGTLGAGGVTNENAEGWRNIFWIQAAFHLATSMGLLVFYRPKNVSEYPKMSLKDYVWACDPVGSGLFISSTTLLLMSLDWAGGDYAWSDPHVAVPLSLGLAFLLAFGLYEWQGRSDGLVAHVFFKGSPNFALSLFAFAIEGWIFYSAVNSVVPQIVLNLGFLQDSWSISIRQLAYNVPCLVATIPLTLYATAYKDLKTPTVATFLLFLVASICYATINPTLNHAQIGYNIISGIGQSGPLTFLVALVQFCAPHAYLSTATGLAFSARAIGGAFGSAVLDAIINGNLAANYGPQVSGAAVAAGMPESSVPALLAALAAGDPAALSAVPGANASVLATAEEASRWAYAHAYNLAWASVVPFVVVATGCVSALRGVKELMTEHVEATVELLGEREDEEAVADGGHDRHGSGMEEIGREKGGEEKAVQDGLERAKS